MKSPTKQWSMTTLSVVPLSLSPFARRFFFQSFPRFFSRRGRRTKRKKITRRTSKLFCTADKHHSVLEGNMGICGVVVLMFFFFIKFGDTVNKISTWQVTWPLLPGAQRLVDTWKRKTGNSGDRKAEYIHWTLLLFFDWPKAYTVNFRNQRQ